MFESKKCKVRKMALSGAAWILTSVPVLANSEVSGPQICGTLAEIGRLIMTERQNGLSMRDAVEQYDAMWVGKGLTPEVEKSFRDYSQQLVIQAYDQPQFSSASYQQDQIREFEDAIFLRCMKKQ